MRNKEPFRNADFSREALSVATTDNRLRMRGGLARRRNPALRSAVYQRMAIEQRRLRTHFRLVLAELRGRDVSHFAPEQRAARAHLIDELARYARTGRFPRNLDFPDRRMPYFVDAFGARCAMAHLVESTGHGELVARVHQTANNAFVRELEADIAFRSWLEEHGITAAEAARIQPDYCFVTKAEDCLCNLVWQSAAAVGEGTVVAPGTEMYKVRVRIDVIHGDMSVAAVGDEIEISGTTAVNSKLFVIFPKDPSTTPSGSFELQSDGSFSRECVTDLPPPTKQNVIDAFLSGNCVETMKKVDPEWGASVCDDSSTGCGCVVVAPTDFSGWLLGSLLVAATMTARRRARRRTYRRS